MQNKCSVIVSAVVIMIDAIWLSLSGVRGGEGGGRGGRRREVLGADYGVMAAYTGN